MAAIFLSYAREDQECAAGLARVLEQAGHEVWWDRHIDSGEDFAAEIEAELDKADIVLVAWSKVAVKSRWVRDEAAAGGDTGRLIPVSVDGSPPPMGFRQFHTLDLAGWKNGRKDSRSAELILAIERKLNGKAGPRGAIAQLKPRFSLPARKAPWIVVGALLITIAAAAFLVWSNREQSHGPLSKPTIALAPFSAASPDAETHSLAALTRDALSHTLAQSGIPVRMLDAIPEHRRTAGDFLLSGELSRSGEKVIATVRLDEAAQGTTVFSSRFEAAGEDIRNLPERIAAQMAGMLSNGATLIALDRRYRTDPSLMAELLATSDDQLQNYQTSKRVAARAPDVPSAQIAVAFYTGFVLGDLPREQRLRDLVAGRKAAERALALAPEFGDTYAAWCLLHSETLMAACEDQLRIGNRVDPDAPYLNTFLADLLDQVGRVDESVEVTRLSYSHDPYDLFKINDTLRMLEFVGDSDGARRLYRQALRWFPDEKVGFFQSRLLGLVKRGDFEQLVALEREVGAEALPANYVKSGAIVGAIKSRSIPALRRACDSAEAYALVLRCMMALATAGDLDHAYAIASKMYPRRVGRTAAETERIWLDSPNATPLEFITSPAAAPLRRDPRFLQLAQRVGLLDYWRSGRLPDFCRKQREPVCGRLSKGS